MNKHINKGTGKHSQKVIRTEAERLGKYHPYVNTSKTYKANGAREVARRLKKTGIAYMGNTLLLTEF